MDANEERWRATFSKEIADKMVDLAKSLGAGSPKVSQRAYEETEGEMRSQVMIFKEIGDLMLEKEGRKFTIDRNNVNIIRLLIAYVNKWTETLRVIGEKCFGGAVDQDKSLMIMGDKGVGKTLLMQVTARFCEVMQLHESGFVNTSSSELLNYFRTNNSLDYFTYNAGRVAVKEGNPYSAKPFNVCLHDLDYQHDEKQKHYGVSMQDVMEDFLMARYELWQNDGLKYHLTTNLDVSGLSRYSPRIVDRFRQHNYIRIEGRSRR